MLSRDRKISMKRSRRNFEEAEKIIMETMKLSHTQRLVIEYHIREIKKVVKGEKQFSLEEVQESICLVKEIYPQLIETRIREITDEAKRDETYTKKKYETFLQGQLKILCWTRARDQEYIESSLFQLSLRPGDLAYLYREESSICAFHITMVGGYMENPAIIALLSKSLRRIIFQNKMILPSLLQSSDSFLYLSRMYQWSLERITQHEFPTIILQLIALDADYRKKRIQLNEIALRTLHYPAYSTRTCSDNQCRCRECSYMSYINLPLYFSKNDTRHSIYNSMRDIMMKSRSKLSRFLHINFSVSI